MKIRHDMLEDADDMGTSGTLIYDLSYVDVISKLDLRFAATNGAGGNKDNPIERNISKIEIVDGSDVLWSLPGDVAYALFTQLTGKPGNTWNCGAISGTPSVEIPILFGRYMYDQELAFNPTRFKNPQLKVTFDEATVRAAGATGFVSDSFTLTIVAHLMEDVPAPRGWLMAKDIYDFTSAGSGDELVAMPTDYPYRLLMVRAYESGVAYDSSISNYKLNCDGGKFVPFDLAAAAIQDLMCEIFPPVTRAGYEYGDHGDTFQTWLALTVGRSLDAHSNRVILGAGSFWPSQFTVIMHEHDGTTLTGKAFHWSAIGWSPHNTMLIPFGRLAEIAEWFDAAAYSKVDLYLTQGDADAEVNVCLQQYRPY